MMKSPENPFESPQAESKPVKKSRSDLTKLDVLVLVIVIAGASLLTGLDCGYMGTGIRIVTPFTLYVFLFIYAVKITMRRAQQLTTIDYIPGLSVAAATAFAACVFLVPVCTATANHGRPRALDNFSSALAVGCTMAIIGVVVFFGVYAIQQAKIERQLAKETRRREVADQNKS